MFEVCKLLIFKRVQGRLLHEKGQIYNKIFCPVLVFGKGWLSLAKLLVSILQCEMNSNKT